MPLETTGKKLKRELGLEGIHNVRISRAVLSSYKILFVWYRSNSPDFPLTRRQIISFPWTAMIFHGTDIAHGKTRRPIFTPLIDIDEYNGTLLGALVITVDMSYDFRLDKKDYSKVLEGIHKYRVEDERLQEFLTLDDLNNKDTISSTTMKFRKERNKIMGTENKQAKLVDVFINQDEDYVMFGFLTEATDKYPDDYVYKEVDPESDFQMKANRSETYEIYIKILEFFSWLDTYDVEEKITQKDIKNILEVANIQIWSTSPSFHWQGFNFWLSQLDSAVFPTDIKPKRWDKIHGDGEHYLDKHTWGLVRQIRFFAGPMASMLTKRLKDKGML